MRLQIVAEEILPESQCGFRKGRGCTDMVFALRQLVEKLKKHRSKGFILFVDLTKAYDSVPRSVLWQMLRKIGVPEEMVCMVRSLHEGMQAVRTSQLRKSKLTMESGRDALLPQLYSIYISQL